MRAKIVVPIAFIFLSSWVSAFAASSYKQDYIDFVRPEVEFNSKEVFAAPANKDKIESWRERIIIAGDSWAKFPCDAKVMEKLIKHVKAEFRNDPRCKHTTELGIEARGWFGSKADINLRNYIQADQSIKYIYLSLGGNDLLGRWNTEVTADQEEELFHILYQDLQKITGEYVKIRPDIKIIISGYDYPNFKSDRKISVFKKMYKQLGAPSALQINSFIARASQKLVKIADYKNIYYIHHLGVSHYYDGGPKGTFAPLATAHPDRISTYNDPAAIGGDLNHPTREESLKRWYKVIRDAFHLNDRNYFNVMLHTYNNILIHIAYKP